MDQEAHILVVDDDSQVRTLIGQFLRENGYRVTGARDGREMRETLAGAVIDLIILDLMLPGTSGIDLCRELRKSSSVPVIMLTAKGDDTDRIVGLEVGADDYLPKPFNPRELLARIRAVLRRAAAGPREATHGGRMITFAGWTLDTLRREVTSPAGVVVDLSGGEYDVLIALVEHPNRILSREQLLELARNRASNPFDRSLDVQISRLRKMIEPDPTQPRYIQTVWGVGYVFVPDGAS